MAKTEEPLLNEYEKRYIADRETALASILKGIESVAKFKEGDYLIAFHNDHWRHKREHVTNSYGAIKKFQVIFSDKLGVPYIKELSKKGQTHWPTAMSAQF